MLGWSPVALCGLPGRWRNYQSQPLHRYGPFACMPQATSATAVPAVPCTVPSAPKHRMQRQAHMQLKLRCDAFPRELLLPRTLLRQRSRIASKMLAHRSRMRLPRQMPLPSSRSKMFRPSQQRPRRSRTLAILHARDGRVAQSLASVSLHYISRMCQASVPFLMCRWVGSLLDARVRHPTSSQWQVVAVIDQT